MSWAKTAPFALFGLTYDDAAVSRFLAGQPPHTAQRPSDGRQYIVCKAGGFDLLFEDPVNRGAGNRQIRKLEAIFLYDGDVHGHRQYPGVLPCGFSFDDTREDLIGKRAPSRTWVIGEGRVPIEHPEPDHDQWEVEGLTVSAVYGPGGERVLYFQVGLPSDEPEWVAPDTWQTLALVPSRKLEAIKLYREAHAVGMAEAKAAVERHAEQQARSVQA